MDDYLPPIGFSQVEKGVYRSAYPIESSFPFLEKFHFKTFLCLCPQDVKSSLLEYTKAKNIQLILCDVKVNQEPFAIMDKDEVSSALKYLQQAENHPILVFCLNGKVRTSCLISCWRRLNGWSIASTIEEYETFSESESNLLDLVFIERFQIRR
jgi:tyrosine-protein phosphatase SIW14